MPSIGHPLNGRQALVGKFCDFLWIENTLIVHDIPQDIVLGFPYIISVSQINNMKYSDNRKHVDEECPCHKLL